MFGLGVTVTSNGRPVHTFADEETAQGFINANSSRHYVLAVRPLNRIIWEEHHKATLGNLRLVHLVR